MPQLDKPRADRRHIGPVQRPGDGVHEAGWAGDRLADVVAETPAGRRRLAEPWGDGGTERVLRPSPCHRMAIPGE